MPSLITILAVLALPAAALAQANARTDAKAPASATPQLNQTNHWGAYQLGCWNKLGCVSPKEGVVFDAIGPLEGENDVFDGVAYNGFAQFMAERYDMRPGQPTGVGPNEVVGGFLGAAQDATGSDPADAGMLLFTTERQTRTGNGMGAEIDYTPNGSTALTRGLSVSPQGHGGVTIGGGGANNDPYKYQRPTDLGPGTLHTAGAIVIGDHLASDGARPALSDCGSASNVVGTDAAGHVANGGAVSSCTVTFARPYASAEVVCIVQDYATATPTPFLTAFGASGFKVAWTAPYGGNWFYICQGVG
jgi:hypothetical protein